MNKKTLLLEYENVTKEIENIRNKILTLKYDTGLKIKMAKSNDEKSDIFVDFKNKVELINKDKETKKKYKRLQKRKIELETELRELTEINNLELFKPDEQINKQINEQIIENEERNSDKSNNLSIESNEMLDEIQGLIMKYKQLVNIPIVYEKIPTKQNINDKDRNQIKKLHNLIKNLKLQIN